MVEEQNEKVKLLEEEIKRLEDFIFDVLITIPEHFLNGYPDWDAELKRIEDKEKVGE